MQAPARTAPMPATLSCVDRGGRRVLGGWLKSFACKVLYTGDAIRGSRRVREETSERKKSADFVSFSGFSSEMNKKRPKEEKPRIVGIKELAAILDLTPRRIQQLTQEGFPKKVRGKYDRDECVGFYIRYLQALVEKRARVEEGGKIFASEREERLRLLRAGADLREIELARERSELVSVVDVDRAFEDLAVTTQARILAVAPRLAPELIGEKSRVMAQAKIERALREAMLVLSKREATR
jgi:phage terminase Nu1 subunit (DNA packaging protein)